MSSNERLCHQKAFLNSRKPGILLSSLRHVYKWNILTSQSLEKSRNSCNSTEMTSEGTKMNYYDKRKPSKTL